METVLKVLKGERVESRVALPGILLTRERPDEVRAFKQRLAEMSK